MKPDISFFVIGAARSGTTSLYDALKAHPQIFVPSLKEPRFFKENWKRGWEWYQELYAAARPGSVAGDFSPSYSNATGRNFTADRIARAYPSARILYMVRNPIDCAISNWRMTAENLKQSIDFRAALTDPQWASAVLDRARFFTQLQEYRRLFADDQILVIPLEAIRADSPAWLARIQAHLGVSSSVLSFPRANASALKRHRPPRPEVSEDGRSRFLELLGDDWRRMLDHIGLPPTFWDVSVTSASWVGEE